MSASIIRVAKRIARRIVGRPIVGRSILMYHRIAAADFDPFNMAVSPDEFGRQLDRLRRKEVLPLREFARLHSQKKLPRNAVAITFDDGYACNALTAAPMLNSFGYPATFFVVSDAIKRAEEFWWDQIEIIVHAQEFECDVATGLLANQSGTGLSRNVHENGGSLAAYLSLWQPLHALSTDKRRQCLDDLRHRLGLQRTTRPSHRPMTAAELRALASNPLFEIGGHTATHPSLPTLAPPEQEREIVIGSRFLEKTIGKPIRSFSYPFGDWGEATREIVKAAGFECAVAGAHRRVGPNDNQFTLPRRLVVNRNAHTP